MGKIVKQYFLVILYFIVAAQLSATTYYLDSSLGNDASSGTTITAPWKTVQKINNSSFQPGDSILFKRGEIWKEYLDFPSSGSSGHPIVIGSYGEGSFPTLTGRNEYPGWNDPTNWQSSEEINIWSRNQSYNHQRMWIDGVEVLRNVEIDSLDGIRYVWAWENSTLYVYSLGNPANTFNLMETNVFYITVRIGNKDYITIQDIEIQGGYGFGLAICGCSNIMVKDCRIGTYSREGIQIRDNLGISSSYITIDSCLIDSKFNFSYGLDYGIDDGIQVAYGAHDCTIKNNVVKDFGHTGIYLRAFSAFDNGVYDNKVFGNFISGANVTYLRGIGTDGYENKCRDNELFNNIISNTTVRNQINGNNNWIHHNIINGIKNSPAIFYPTAQGIDLQGYGNNTVCHDNKIDNNLIMNCDEPGIYFRGNGNPKDHNFVRNNVILNCGKNSIGGYANIAIAIENDSSILTNYFYNNCVFNGDDTSNVIYLRGVRINVAAFNSQSATSDSVSNNIQKDPLMVTSDSLHYFITQYSPCIDAGIDVGLTHDFYGNVIFSGNAPDIGIHEYSSPVGIFSKEHNVAGNFLLKQNYPNPFNPSTSISFQLPVSSFVNLTVYNSLGQKVIVLLNTTLSRGEHQIEFDGRNLSSGTYYYSLKTNKYFNVKKMLLIR